MGIQWRIWDFERGEVPLSRTFSTALVRAHEAGDACEQNDKNGDSGGPEEPPWIHHWCILTGGIVIVKLKGPLHTHRIRLTVKLHSATFELVHALRR